jgi:hypothetical protein
VVSLEIIGQVVRSVIPTAEFLTDNDGQIIIYTGLYEVPGDHEGSEVGYAVGAE